MGPRSSELILELQRVLPKPRPVVFGAFADPDELRHWWGPEGFTVPRLVFHARPGQAYRIQMQPPEGEPFSVTGVFREVQPPERLAYTFAWEPPDPDDVETLVRLSLLDLGGSTEVALVQGAFTTEARRALHRDGWTESFDRLERFLSEQA